MTTLTLPFPPVTLQQPVAALTEATARDEAAYLSHILRIYDHAYYQQDRPQVSDREYDTLRQRLNAIAQQFPQLNIVATHHVGAAVTSGFTKVTHKLPMLSLANVYNNDELVAFFVRVKKFLNMPESSSLMWMAEPKMDGLAVSVRYENGQLVQVATRGDGVVGEDITAQFKTILSVPHTLPVTATVEVRGEVYMNRDDFLALNRKLSDNGEEPFVNPRNAAAGSLRLLNIADAAARPLQFMAHGMGEWLAPRPSTYHELMQQLRAWSLPTNRLMQGPLTELDVANYYQSLLHQRTQLPYDIDGVVIKLDDIHLQQRLGSVGRDPRWAVAYKFKAAAALTVLKKIAIQVGRTGVLTPVAELEPVSLGGVTVSRASLHNADEIARKDIRVGDTVCVERAGDVIPYITHVEHSKRQPDAEPYQFPVACPSCGTPVLRDGDDVAIVCPAHNTCPAQNLERLRYVVSKAALDIVGLGEMRLEELVACGFVRTPADIFRLPQRVRAGTIDLASRDGWGQQSVDKLMQAIEARRTQPLARFLVALAIPQVGGTTASLLAKHFGSIEAMMQRLTMTKERPRDAIEAELLNIHGIGSAMAHDLIAFFNNPSQRDVMADWLSVLTVQPYQSPVGADSDAILRDQRIVFTGTLQTMSRAEAKAWAERLGAQVVSSVSAQTSLLVAGEEAGSKLTHAQKLGVRILDEAAWLKLIETKSFPA